MGEDVATCEVGLDGLYRINRVGFSLGVNPDGELIACKGSWIGDDAFSIEFHIIGDPSRQNIQLRFAGDKARMVVSEPGMETAITGTFRFRPS